MGVRGVGAWLVRSVVTVRGWLAGWLVGWGRWVVLSVGGWCWGAEQS